MNRALTVLVAVLVLGAGFLGGLAAAPRQSVTDNPSALSPYERGQLIAQCYAIQEQAQAVRSPGPPYPSGAPIGSVEKCLAEIKATPTSVGVAPTPVGTRRLPAGLR